MAEQRRRGPMALLVIPLIAVLAVTSRIPREIRTVDFLRIFFSGVLLGITVMAIVQTIRERNRPAA